MLTVKQSQAFPSDCFTTPRTPPAEEKEIQGKFWVFAPATEGSGRGAQMSPFVVRKRFEQSRVIQHNS